MMRLLTIERPFESDGGLAFLAPLPCGLGPGDVRFLLEDGRAIGQGESIHQDIRDRGHGLLSIAHDAVRFSSSDGSDCGSNGRSYAVAVLEDTTLHPIAEQFIGADTTRLLSCIAKSSHNNSFFINFFTYYRTICECLQRNNMAIPGSILEIGSGAKPYTGLKFLLAGAKRFVACDLFEVENSFSPEFVSAMVAACDLIDPAICARANRVFTLQNGAYSAAGLEVMGRTSFEQAQIDCPVDLIVSISALEHVADPEGTARKMAEILPLGGLMFHSIDFRDHHDFEKPLEFLKLSANEYAPIATENRLRAGDWTNLLEKYGFEIVERCDQTVLLEPSQCMPDSRPESRYRFYGPGEKVQATVTEKERQTFAAPFNSKSLEELSITRSQILCRKFRQMQ